MKDKISVQYKGLQSNTIFAMNTTILTNEVIFEEVLPEGYVKSISDFLGYSVDFVRKVLKGERHNKYILMAAFLLGAKTHKTKTDLEKLLPLVKEDLPPDLIKKYDTNP